MMRKTILFAISLLLLATCLVSISEATEIVRQKNVATIVTFPVMKNDGTLITGATGLDSEIDAWTDGAAPDGFADCTNEATEIGTTGQYYLSLAQAEMNNTYIIIQTKSSSTGAVTQTLLIRTMIGVPANMATTDDGGAINVTTGAIDTVTTTTTATNLTTNNDKTGYTASTVSDKTGYSLLQAFPTNFSALSISATTGLVDITQTAADKAWGTTARALTDKTGFGISSAAAGDYSEIGTDVWATGTRVLTALDEDSTTIDLNGSTVGGLTTWDKSGYALSAAGVDAIWDELLSGHTTDGSAGKKLSDIPESGTGDWTSAEKADILEALSVEDGTANTDLDDIKTQIKIHR